MSLVHFNKKKLTPGLLNICKFKSDVLEIRDVDGTRMFIRLVKCPVSGEELRKQRITGFVGKIELLNLNIVE